MPPKLRELVEDLESAGFRNRGGKGSHRNFRHPRGVMVTLSGALGEDVRHYQEKAVKLAIQKVAAQEDSE